MEIGISSVIDPIKMNFGPDYKENSGKLPGSPQGAAEALKNDQTFLLKGDVFTEAAIKQALDILK